MRISLVPLAFAVMAVVACDNPTAPHPEGIVGVYAEQNISQPFVADTVTLTADGINTEKTVRAIDGGTYAMVNRGTYTYDSTSHTLSRINGQYESVWQFDGEHLTSGTEVFARVHHHHITE